MVVGTVRGALEEPVVGGVIGRECRRAAGRASSTATTDRAVTGVLAVLYDFKGRTHNRGPGVEQESGARLGHEPALDGLRGLAVLAVLAFHLGPRLHVGGGYLGVDLFFVLSGFLITTLLVQEWRGSRHIRLGAFWMRRARRLLPAVVVLVGAVGLYAAISVAYGDRFRADALGTLLYVQNWHNIVDPTAYPSPLNHAWSLAVEEQFYLVWPLVTIACLRWRRNLGALVAVTVTGIVLSVAAGWVLAARGSVEHAYAGTDARMHEILIGALLACALGSRLDPRRQGTWLDALGIAGLIALLAAFLLAPGHTDARLYMGGNVLFALAAICVIAAALHPKRGATHFVLSIPALRWVGLISYGLYLWHWPVDLVLTPERLGVGFWPSVIIRTGTAFAIAAASYYWIELPIRRGEFPFRTRLPRPSLTPIVATALAIAVLAPTAWRLSDVRAERQAAFHRDAAIEVAATTEASVPETTPPTAPKPLAPSGEPIRVLLVGDDVVAAAAPHVESALGDRVQVRVDTRPGTDLVYPVDWPAAVAAHVAEFQPTIVVAHFAAAGTPLEPAAATAPLPGVKGWYDAWAESMRELIDVTASNGAGLYVLETPPHRDPHQDRRAQFLDILWQGRARQVAFIDTRDALIAPDGGYTATAADPAAATTTATLRADDGYGLTREGGRRVAERIVARLDADWCLLDPPRGCTPGFSLDPPIPRAQQDGRIRVLLVGDSIMWQLSPVLLRRLEDHPRVDVLADPRSATDLPGDYDWPGRFDALVLKWNPDIVVGQFLPDLTRLSEPGYSEVFYDAIRDATARLGARGAIVIWIGGPPVDNDQANPIMAGLEPALLSLPADLARRTHVIDAFAPLGGTFSLEGGAPANGTGEIMRMPDGIHLAPPGVRMLSGVVADAVMPSLAEASRVDAVALSDGGGRGLVRR